MQRRSPATETWSLGPLCRAGPRGSPAALRHGLRVHQGVRCVPYHVEGSVPPNGDLILEGAAPYVVEGCWVYGYRWDSHNAHLVFTQVVPVVPPTVEGLMR
jgi:hypothetical protein